MARYVTVSAKIDAELRKRLAELGISPSEAIRRALEREVEEKMRERLYKKIGEASPALSKLSREAWAKAIRESRDER
jgi:antitoxin component of RelBE/YafQ-DinJ toxin-antitoxin module